MSDRPVDDPQTRATPRRSTRGRRSAQIALAVWLFALPLLLIPVALREPAGDLWTRAGLPKDTVKCILVPGGAVPSQYALVARKGVYRSVDYGVTWLAKNSGLPSAPLGGIEVQAFAMAEGPPLLLFAGMGGIGSTDAALSAGLYVSDDGGVTWIGRAQDMAGREVVAIAVLADSSAGLSTVGEPAAPVVYAATRDGIYYSSADYGSWAQLDWRGGEIPILSVAVGPGDPKVLYVGTKDYGLYASSDGGLSWTELNQGLGSRDVYAIAISGTEPNRVYLGTESGVYRSMDAGSTWIRAGGAVEGHQINAIAVHPWDASFVYAATRGGGVCISTDAGREWAPMKRGLGNLTVLSLAVDPGNQSVLWAGTTDGIWRYVFDGGVSAAVVSGTPTHTVAPTVTPTHTSSPQASSTLSSTPAAAPIRTVTAMPTETAPPSPTATQVAQPTPTVEPTLTPTATETSRPPPTSVPPAPTETLAPR